MSNAKDFLVEIGTEELPPKALRTLMDAFGESLLKSIDDAHLAHGDMACFASPRRLTVLVHKLAEQQEDRNTEQKGPPVKIAFDSHGEPTAAAVAFAERCGVAVADLGRNKTDKGEWLSFDSVLKGKTVSELLPGMIEVALNGLPIPRRMRWGASDAEFVRPVHWIVLLHGSETIKTKIMGIETGNTSQGHRFHAPGTIKISSPDTYINTLAKDGHVIADFERRREMIREGVDALAREAGGQVVDGELLYDEVAALVEWPVPLLGSFDAAFLELPREAVVSTLTGHQRYFPVADDSGRLLPKFITVANLDSKDSDQVRDGNERVIRPRLADAAFFWSSDRQKKLADRCDGLADVVYQQGLGSLADKSRRVAAIAKWLAANLKLDEKSVVRAAALAKCDLLTGMVGEFPELQGTMGRYYAAADGEEADVATAIGEQYLPRFAGDTLPQSPAGRVLAIADKLDTLAGVFSLGKKPSGSRDPFGLRRAALGVVRILIETGIDIDLKALIVEAVKAQPKSKLDIKELANDLYGFLTDRLRPYFQDRDAGLSAETFEAVMVRQPSSLLDFDRRLAAVQTFARLEQAASLAAANKRIANILRQADDPAHLKINKKLLQDDAERQLFDVLEAAQQKLQPLLDVRRYADALNELAELRDPVDRFFDEVMVMAEDEAVKNNRLALLSELRALFLRIADISRLSIS